MWETISTFIKNILLQEYVFKLDSWTVSIGQRKRKILYKLFENALKFVMNFFNFNINSYNYNKLTEKYY